MTDRYRAQVMLLLRILPLVARQDVFALKGGTAINLFERDLPRLSVDIDLTYLPFDDRETALKNIADTLDKLKVDIERTVPGVTITTIAQKDGTEAKLHCQHDRTLVKIEVNTTMRGHLFAPRKLPIADRVEQEFEAFVQMQLVSKGELYGGKLCAALDRQHPRDLFDVQLLLDDEGISEEIRGGFIASLLSHPRPIAELLSPNLKDQRKTFDSQFAGMANVPFEYGDYEATQKRLVEAVNEALTASDKEFILSFKTGEPDWSITDMPDLQRLPAVLFKLSNIQKLKQSNPAKHKDALAKLRAHFEES